MTWKRILALLTAVLAIVGITLLVSDQVRVRRTADPAALVREIQALNQLVTVRYRIQKVRPRCAWCKSTRDPGRS